MLRYYDSKNKRLIYIHQTAPHNFWEHHWHKVSKTISFSDSNTLILNLMRKYLSDKKGIILDGGCGLGDKVYFMDKQGYNAVGIDLSKKTILRVKKEYPQLNLLVGDCSRLPFKPDIFRAYWSLGVIEHSWHGYDQILAEIHRVLQNNGYLFITFPSLSPLRKIKTKLHLYKEYSPSLPISINRFYQFVLDEQSVIKKCEDIGFTLIEKKRYDAIKGFKDEINLLKPFLQKIYDSSTYSSRIFKLFFDIIISPMVGHMSFLVLKQFNP